MVGSLSLPGPGGPVSERLRRTPWRFLGGFLETARKLRPVIQCRYDQRPAVVADGAGLRTSSGDLAAVSSHASADEQRVDHSERPKALRCGFGQARIDRLEGGVGRRCA